MVDYEALAQVVVESGTEIAATFIGPEWRPQMLTAPGGAQFDERLTLVKPIARYLEEKQMPDLPPGVLVLLAIGLYSSRRFQVPNTRQKVGGMMKMAWGKVTGFFKRKKKAAPGAIVVKPEAEPTAEEPSHE
jgi:hypothetical protein